MMIKVVSSPKFTVAFLVGCFFIFSITKCSEGGGDDKKQPEVEGSSKMAIIDAAKSLFSLRTDKIKTLFRQSWWPYSPPDPNIDFRRGDEDGGGATEKVKDAAVRSLDESKAAVEHSAKSAALFAEEAVDKTVKKLKKTLEGEL